MTVVDEIRWAFEPVQHWYEGDGGRTLAQMVGDAVADLQHDREIALKYQREHPKDENLSINRDWMWDNFQIGDEGSFQYQQRFILIGSLRILGGVSDGTAFWKYSLWVGSMKIKDNPTRGDVRKILSLIEKEKPDEAE